MKQKTNLIFFIIILLFSTNSFSGQYTGAFLNVGSGGRAVSLGNTGFIDNYDATSIYWNPALLSKLSSNQLSLMLSSPFNKVDDIYHHSVFYSDNRNIYYMNFNIGIGIIYQDASSMKWTDNQGRLLGSFSSKEYAYLTGISTKINDELSFGATFKLIHQKIFNYSDFGYGLDLGIIYLSENKFQYALSLKNIIPPELKLNNKKENISFRLETGIYKRYGDFNINSGITAVDDDIFIKSGIEYMYFDIACLRFGYETETKSFAVGLGMNFEKAVLDYTYKQHSDLGGTHLISFNIINF